jgi:hypothetical protein
MVGVLLIALVLVITEPKTEFARRKRWRQRLVLGLRLLQGLLGAFAEVVSNLIVLTIPGTVRPVSPALLLLGIAFPIVLPLPVEAIRARVGRRKPDRDAFLGQLAKRYDAYLDDPLQRAVRAALGAVETPAALRRLDVIVETLGTQGLSDRSRSVRVLPPEATLLEVFEESGRHLLILGEPGAGKSTQLHELARAL